MNVRPLSYGWNKFTSDSQGYLAGCPATPSIGWGAPGEEPARGIRLGQVDGGWRLHKTEDAAMSVLKRDQGWSHRLGGGPGILNI